MGRRVPVADKAIAQAALDEIATEYASFGDVAEVTFPEFLLEWAAKVKFQPSTRQLVLTFDLGMGEVGDQPDAPLSSQPD